MAFREQRNVFGGLAGGLQQAGQAIAGFFQQRAQQQFERGVSDISWAQAELAKMDELQGNVDVQIPAEKLVALNARREQLNRIVSSAPQQASALRAALTEWEKSGGVDVANIMASVTSTGPGKPLAPRGVQSGVPGETNAAPATTQTTPASRTSTPVPFGQMFAGLQREAAQGARSYAESQADLEFERVLIRDDRGFDHEVDIAQLENLAALDRARLAEEGANARAAAGEAGATARQEAQAGFDAELARLASELQISEDALLAGYQLNRDTFLAALDEKAKQADETRTIAAADREFYSTQAQNNLAIVRDPLRSPQEREAAAAILREMRDQGQLGTQAPLYSDEILAQNLRMVDPKAREAQEAAWQDIIDNQAMNDVERRQAEVNLRAARQGLIIGGQNVTMNRLAISAQEIANGRAAFDADHARVTTARDFVEQAVTLARPEYLRDLREEITNPGSHPELAHLAGQVSVYELDAALEVAEVRASDEDLMRQQLRSDVNLALRANGFESAAQGYRFMGEVVASGMSPAEIAADPGLQMMRGRGLLTEQQMSGMMNQAELRGILERETANGPAITRAFDRLTTEYSSKMPQTPEEYAAAEAGLRSTLNELVSLGALQEGEVEGLVALYTRAWSNGNNQLQLEFAEMTARTNLLSAQAADYYARVNGTGGYAPAPADGTGNVPMADPQLINATVNALTARKDKIREQFPYCAGTVSSTEAEGAAAVLGTMSADCAEYDAQLDDWQADYDLTMQMLGLPISTSTYTTQEATLKRNEVLELYGDQGEAAWDATSLSRWAKNAGYDVEEFVPDGVADPIAWMARYGKSPEDIQQNLPSPEETRTQQVEEERWAQAQQNPRWQEMERAWLADPKSNLGFWNLGAIDKTWAQWAEELNVDPDRLRRHMQGLVNSGAQPRPDPNALPGPVYSPEDQSVISELGELADLPLNGANRRRAAEILESYNIPLPFDMMSGAHPGRALILLQEHLKGQQ